MTPTISFSRTIPVLRIFSVDKAREFYIDYLGFTIDWEHRFADDLPLYMQVSRDGFVLHLSEHHGDATPGSRAFIVTNGIEALHEELAAKSYGYLRPELQDAPWGARVLEVTDPFGNRITFNEFADDRSE